MGIKDFSFSPLFFLFGIYYAVTGRIAVFVIYTLTALLHEIGHSISAERRGYYLNKITLMPFGAVVSGETEGMKVKDELFIALAGPLLNLCIALAFIALWWIYPPFYPYTDIIVEANLTLAVINFLPFFPLDGGRILLCLIALKTEREKAIKICKGIGVVGGLVLLGLFIASIFYTLNLTLLFFSLFIVFGACSKKGDNKYLKLCTSLNAKKLTRGMTYKKIGIDKTATVKRLTQMLDGEYLNEVVIFDNGKPIKTLSPSEIEPFLLSADLYKPISYNLGKISE